MKNSNETSLTKIPLDELWAEIGRRFKIKFGKVEKAFHNGKPSDFTQLNVSIPTSDVIDLTK